MFTYFACIATFITVFNLERPEKFCPKSLNINKGFAPNFCLKTGRFHECQISEISS